MTKPLVTIHCLVYNHAPFLRECLEGFVMQRTNFPFVAIVHDDASTDNSAEVIREYAEKYPNIIHPILEQENQYMKGTLSQTMNEAIAQTGAKYIALCEGDDYWTDPYKLQKQVDFMEAHPEYTLCCHRYRIYNQNTDTWQNDYISEEPTLPHDADFEFGNKENFNCWITKTMTLLYRADAFEPSIRLKYKYNRDIHLNYHILKNGKGYCMNFDGAVYRRHEGGVFSPLDSEAKRHLSYVIYRELYSYNTEDRDLFAYLKTLRTARFDDLRWQVQHRNRSQYFKEDICFLLQDMKKETGLRGCLWMIRKLVLSYYKGF